jgi:hypothetical protein
MTDCKNKVGTARLNSSVRLGKRDVLVVRKVAAAWGDDRVLCASLSASLQADLARQSVRLSQPSKHQPSISLRIFLA